MTKARELAELGKAVSVHDNRVDFDRGVVIPGLIDAAGTTTIADGSITTAKIADDAVTTAKVDTNIAVGGTLGVTGVLTGTSLDISGDIDVDGVTNLDVVDIDGAVDMASTLIVAGNVGIGTSSPDNTLHVHTGSAGNVTANVDFDDLVVESNGNMGMTFLSPNNTFQQIGFGDVDDNDIGKIVYQHTNDSMQFVVNTSERMRITSAGNVGIGTNSPSAKLQVEGTLAVRSSSSQVFNDGSNANNLTMNDSKVHFNLDGADKDFQVSSDTITHALFVQGSDGAVGIGTSSPSALIHGNGSSVSALLLTTNSYTSGTEFKVQGDGASYIYNKQNAMLRFGTNNLERIRITSAGNVGIGTTSAVANLEIKKTVSTTGSMTDTALHLTTDATTGRKLNIGFGLGGGVANTNAAVIGFHVTSGTGATQGDLFFSTRSGTSDAVPTERVRINSAGNIGIGTASPSFRLQVSGTNTQIGIESTTSNQNASLYYTANGANQWEVGTNITAGLNYEVYDRVNNASRLVVTHDAKVGIGTSSPSQILHINAAEPHVRIVNSTNTSYSGGTSKISLDNPSGGAAARGMISEQLYTWAQTTADSWILVRTPQAYAAQQAGGWAEMKLAWTGYHATNNTLMMWTAVFHNNHGRVFSWSKSAVTTIGGGTGGSYNPYFYNAAVAFYKQTSAGGGYNTSDSWMRNLYIKVSGNAASSVCTKRSLYIKGLSGGFDYEIAHAGTSTPAGGLASV